MLLPWHLLLDSDPDVDRIAEWVPIGVDGLPGAFINALGEGSCKQDVDGCACPGAGRVKGDLLGRTEGGSANVPEAVGGIPVTGAAVLHQPLLIKRKSECGKHIIRDGEVFEKGKVIRAVRRVD